jgi:catechol 2,3-dioxygenase-like lactoylglutathione lyase family enzyme
MGLDVGYLHHVGLVVRDIEEAMVVYRRLGFELDPPSYPMLPTEAGDFRPFGAANAHVHLARGFVELVTVVSESSPVPTEARRVPLQVPIERLPHIKALIGRTVGQLASRLERFQGLHRLVFQTPDASLTAERLTRAGVAHSGVNTTGRPIQTERGPAVETIRHLEIDAGAPEGILAMAEKTSPPRGVRHPNGAIDLVDVILCVAPERLASVAGRYETYLGRAANASGRSRVFPLEEARLTVVSSDGLADVLPGEQPIALPALIGYAVTVRDLAETEAFLRRQGFSPASTPAGDRLVSATAALGAAVIFRQAAAG